MNRKPVHFFDTTLRDGEQSHSFNPSSNQRADLAKLLEAAGVSVIELVSTEQDAESLAQSRQIAMGLNSSTVCCLSQLNPGDLQTARTFLDDVEKARIHLYLDRKRMCQIESDPSEAGEILNQMSELIAAAKTEFPEVEFSPQDATRFGFDTLSRVVEVALVAGADIISISDTVGTSTPEHIRNLFQALSASVPDLNSVTLSLHAHNHEGRAVENVLAAIECGVTQIEGTINGVGPAGGNTDLLCVVAKLEDMEEYDLGELNPGSLRAIGAEFAFTA